MVAILVNPHNPLTESVTKDVQHAAATTGHRIRVVNASRESDFGPAFATMAELRAGALIVGGDPLVRYRELETLVPQVLARGITVQVVTSAFRPLPPASRCAGDGAEADSGGQST